jgi:nucleotide-binding universal stress UspA family protein
VRFGDPVTEILAGAAAFGADLIVMSTKAASGISRVVLGSVAEQVLRKAAPAVMLFRGTREAA